MATLYRVRRTQLNNAPNTIDVVTGSQNIAMVYWRASNYQNSSDSWIGFHNATSGTVVVGTTPSDYGRFLIPAQAERESNLGTEQNPLAYFPNGLTAIAFNSETATTSPTNYLTIEVSYYK